jgi:hypothetical protein
MQNFLQTTYGKTWSKNRIEEVYKILKPAAKKMGLTFDADFLIDNNVGECLQFFKHLLSFDENHKVLGEDLMTYKTSFFRDYVCNKETDFYVDYSRFYVKPEELISFAKSIGGKVFLAHPYEYRLKDVDDLLNTVKDLGVDGIEC